MNRTAKLVTSSLLIAFGIALPVVFHAFGGMGSVFLPMHIPVLIAGLYLGRNPGLAVGFITPILSNLLTGMPPLFPTLPMMLLELSLYGFISGWLYHDKQLKLWVSLTAALVIGRIAAFGILSIVALLFELHFSPAAYFSGALITGLPGIMIQLILIPPLVTKLQKFCAHSTSPH